VVLGLAPWSVLGWQSVLREAWVAASDVGRIQDQVRALESNPALAVELGVTPEGVSRELAALVGGSPARTADEFGAQMTSLMADRARRVVSILRSAAPPRDVPTRRATDRAAQRLAQLLAQPAAEVAQVEEAAAILGRRADEASDMRLVGRTVVLCSHVGGLRRAQADLLERLGRTEEAREARLAARKMYEEAGFLDPFGVHHPLRAARVAAALGEVELAGIWAARALENHANSRLDPLMGLTEPEVAEMERLEGAAAGLDGG
jgi:hypothetical protein